MEIRFLCQLTFVMFLFMSMKGQATTIRCSDFASEAKILDAKALQKQKALELTEKQLQSSTKAIEDFNKNCRIASNANCNPGMYDIISGQTSVLSGQQQSLLQEIRVAKSKQAEAIGNLKSCKDMMKNKLL